MAVKRKKVVRIDNSAPTLVIEDGQVKAIAKPVEEELVVEEEEKDSGKPKWTIKTPNGDAVYEFSGNCFDCEQEKRITPVFHCISDQIRADAELGNQLASFWNEGGGFSAPLCMTHYSRRLGSQGPQQKIVYRIVEDNRFPPKEG
jgi:hypothetical protein